MFIGQFVAAITCYQLLGLVMKNLMHRDAFINERTKYPLFVSRTLDFYF